MASFFHLLQLEWLKINQHRGFRVLVAMYLLLLPTLILIGKRLPELPPPLMSADTFYQFPGVFVYLGYEGSWLCFFLMGFLGVLFVTQEFSFRTLRQNIISGLSRQEYYLSKLYFMLVVCLAATLYYALVAFFYGLTHTPDIFWSVIAKNLDYIPRYFLMSFGYMSFAFLLALLLRKTGIALFLYFGYIVFIEHLIRWVIHLRIVENSSMHYYPMNAIEDLTPLPFAEMAQGFQGQYGFSIFLSPTQATLTAIIYILLFLVAAYRLLLKRDL